MAYSSKMYKRVQLINFPFINLFTVSVLTVSWSRSSARSRYWVKSDARSLFDVVFPVILTMASIELERGHSSLKQLGYTNILYKRRCALWHIIRLSVISVRTVVMCCVRKQPCMPHGEYIIHVVYRSSWSWLFIIDSSPPPLYTVYTGLKHLADTHISYRGGLELIVHCPLNFGGKIPTCLFTTTYVVIRYNVSWPTMSYNPIFTVHVLYFLLPTGHSLEEF